MSEILNFRSAFNGFHREDVVHYIEYLNAKHTTEVNQLNAELEQLLSGAGFLIYEHLNADDDENRDEKCNDNNRPLVMIPEVLPPTAGGLGYFLSRGRL